MIHIELRCGDLSEQYAKGTNTQECCWSYDKDNWSDQVDDTEKEVLSRTKLLFKNAEFAGWVRMTHGFVCPYCVSQRLKVKIESELAIKLSKNIQRNFPLAKSRQQWFFTDSDNNEYVSLHTMQQCLQASELRIEKTEGSASQYVISAL